MRYRPQHPIFLRRRLAVAAVALTALAGAAMPAWGQSDLREMQNRIQRLETEIQTLNQQVYRGGGNRTGATAGAAMASWTMKRLPWAILLAPLVCVICACGLQKPVEPSPPCPTCESHKARCPGPAIAGLRPSPPPACPKSQIHRNRLTQMQRQHRPIGKAQPGAAKRSLAWQQDFREWWKGLFELMAQHHRLTLFDLHGFDHRRCGWVTNFDAMGSLGKLDLCERRGRSHGIAVHRNPTPRTDPKHHAPNITNRLCCCLGM